MNEASGWKNGGDYAAEWLAEKAVNFTTDALTQYDDELKAIVCDNDDMSSAVQAYCNSVGREDIVCIGVDGNAGPLMMVKQGTLGATVFQDGAGQMRYAMELIPLVLKGDKTTKQYFNAKIPFILVTKDNVGESLK
jgi:ABC-type sugar transport system substrate-binding protein